MSALFHLKACKTLVCIRVSMKEESSACRTDQFNKMIGGVDSAMFAVRDDIHVGGFQLGGTESASIPNVALMSICSLHRQLPNREPFRWK